MSRKRDLQASKHACNQCRTAKLRCFVDTVAQHGKCRRCYDGSKDCTFEEMAPRSRRERSDTRLRLLEQEVRSLKARFESTNLVQITEPESSNSSPATNQTDATLQTRDNHAALSIDVMDQDEDISRERSEQLYQIFATLALPQYPVAVLPEGVKLADLEQSKPLLAFAILTAAARGTDPDLFRKLHLELSRTLAEKIVVRGEKSIELLQCLLIAEVWCDTPDDLARLNFYSWLQIAANLARELGLWWDSTVADAIVRDDADQGQRERWRISLATYLSLSAVSVSLQRPSPAVFSKDTREALAKFTITANHPNDGLLASWLTLQLMAEEIEALRLNMKANADAVDGFQVVIANIENRLILFEQTAILNESLRVHYHYVKSKLLERSVQFLRIQLRLQHGSDATLTQSIHGRYELAIIDLIRALHDIINTVTRMDPKEYLHCPTVTTVRALYAIRTLHLLQCSMPRSRPSGACVSIHSLIDFDRHLRQLDQFLMKAKGDVWHRMPTMALGAIKDAQERDTAESVSAAVPQVEAHDLGLVTSPTLIMGDDRCPPDCVCQSCLNQAAGSVDPDPQTTSHTLYNSAGVGADEDMSSMLADLPDLDQRFWGLFAFQDHAWSSDT